MIEIDTAKLRSDARIHTSLPSPCSSVAWSLTHACDEIDRLRALLRRAGEALNARDYHESNAAWRDIARTVAREIEEALGHE